ncbi:unnamed protein product [Pleuronectes platessa]|uniref:Uncharacterized protein n=1 Tax=Pleuronectes platessa TaxID=8262 RepID=A0A9N7U469_PLEPL|nr:unnamed protein product [Pleuronectes platessa]
MESKNELRSGMWERVEPAAGRRPDSCPARRASQLKTLPLGPWPVEPETNQRPSLPIVQVSATRPPPPRRCHGIHLNTFSPTDPGPALFGMKFKVDVTSERGSWLEASRENLSKQIGSDGRVLNFSLRYREISGVTSLSWSGELTVTSPG